MSLRIRRGLNSDRITKVLDAGEIAWTIDGKKLYVGDGSTTGGVNILANSVGTGLEWDNSTQTIRYTGALGSALANVIEDTSPQLGGNLDLNYKTITGTGTINLTGNISATALSLTTGLTSPLPLNGNNITGTGNVNITGNLSASGTIIATTGLGANLPLHGYNITGTGDIDITGALTITGSATTTGLESYGTINIMASSQRSLSLSEVSGESVALRGITDGTLGGFASTAVSFSKGTTLSPTNTLAGEYLGGVAFKGYRSNDATKWTNAASIITQWDATATFGSSPASNLIFTTNNNVGRNILSFNYKGVLTAPIFKATSYAATAFPTSPEEGWIIFDSTNKQFKGWSGSNWDVLN
jgi:hypothetical protein